MAVVPDVVLEVVVVVEDDLVVVRVFVDKGGKALYVVASERTSPTVLDGPERRKGPKSVQ